jgi:hypothetical protein
MDDLLPYFLLVRINADLSPESLGFSISSISNLDSFRKVEHISLSDLVFIETIEAETNIGLRVHNHYRQAR